MDIETITEAEASTRHPGCVIDVIDRADDTGAARPAIYVWDSEEDAANDDGANAVAIYWCKAAAC